MQATITPVIGLCDTFDVEVARIHDAAYLCGCELRCGIREQNSEDANCGAVRGVSHAMQPAGHVRRIQMHGNSKYGASNSGEEDGQVIWCIRQFE